MGATYRGFMAWILERVTYRVKTGRGESAVFRSNRVARTYSWPVQRGDENDEAYRGRKREFQVPRGSDLSLMLALADEALQKEGYKSDYSTRVILTELEALARKSGWNEEEYRKRHIPWLAFRNPFGSSNRSRRSNPVKSSLSKFERSCETVRTQVARYKKKHKDFDKEFDLWWNMYRYDVRDERWFEEKEPGYRERFECNRRELGDDNRMVAMEAGGLAQLYQEFGRDEQALPLLKFALKFWRTHGEKWPHDQTEAVRKLEEEIRTLTTRLEGKR